MSEKNTISKHKMINVILSIQARLLRELMQRAFSEIADIQVIGASVEDEQLKTLIETHDVQWVVVDTDIDDHFEELLSKYQFHPGISVLGVALDGSFMKLHWTEVHRQKIQNPSFNEIVKVLGVQMSDGAVKAAGNNSRK